MGKRRIIRDNIENQRFLSQRRRRNRNNQRRRRSKKSKKVKKIPKSTLERTLRYRERSRRILNESIEEDIEHDLGPMDVLCCYCSARHFSAEKVSNKGNSFNDCCSHGEVLRPNFKDFPEQLRSLLTLDHPLSADFLRNIRSYNTLHAFASLNANLMNFEGKRRGPYCFKIRGHIYYQINTALYPDPNKRPSYGQLFILDPDDANQERLNTMSGLNEDLLRLIDSLLRRVNPFSQSYQMMKNVISDLERKIIRRGGNISTSLPEVTMTFLPRRGMDARRYNPQKINEVAAIFTTTSDGEIPDSYVTIHSQSGEKLKYVSSMDPRVEPWVYPLFYPTGNFGWHRDLCRQNSNKRISRSAYIKNLIAIRDEFNPFLLGRRLFQEWITDNYVKIEKDRTEYCRQHQKNLRVESYQGLIDHIENRAMTMNKKIGKMIILPSTFIGSPRNMTQNYQDAMAIVRKYGKPDLFITMTCNPNWNEIRSQLLSNQQPCDRPDIVGRVFNLKKEALLDMITKKEIFGKIQAYVYVIEFQKRGLPHMHLLITLKSNYKVLTSKIIDTIICAEIPDPEEDPRLHNIVMQNMIHGPCGNWCKIDGKCSKHFPKSFNEETIIDENSYPHYQRRDIGKYYQRPNNYVVDNRWVVPYSPFILRKFNSHCNVEIVSSLKSVKYLYKYIYKGHDAANIHIQGEATNVDTIIHDEINEHIEARYVGPVEAFWRITGKKLQGKSHAIIRLPIHLPKQQNLTIDPDIDDLNLYHILEQKTMLLEYFDLNERDEAARNYFYSDIPSHFTFNKIKINGKIIGKWEKRKNRSNVIGRIYSVSPTQVELFHLRLLLLTIKGATCFENLRTVSGVLCQSFTEACITLGLIADDDEWKRAMHEAEIYMMPFQLRRLFNRILIHCHPLDPLKLWDEFKTTMSEDFRNTMDPQTAEIEAYKEMSLFMEKEGYTITDFFIIPCSISETNGEFTENQLNEIYQKGIQFYNNLNEEQKIFVDEVMNSIEGFSIDNSKCFYIDGPGGSGKTFIYITLYHLLIGKRKKVNTMAFTGIAATLLPYGKTVHKTFGLPVPLYHDSSSNIKSGTKQSRFLQEIDVFIWDEAPMAPRYALEIMDRLLRDIMDNNTPFGGKIMILGGDFRQLLPVNRGGTRGETVNLSLKYSSLWENFRISKLTNNMRTLPQEIDFSKFLLDVGNGILNDDDDYILLPEIITNSNDVNIAEDVYGELLREKRYKYTAKCAVLAPRNCHVDEINEEVVKLLDINTERIYTSVDMPLPTGNDQITKDLVPEYLNTLNPSSLPPHELRLRQFTIVMLIRNLSINEGLCNGTRLLILELGNNLLRCEILTGDKAGEIIFLNRIILNCEEQLPIAFSRRQFPIKIAFAITINKSQGQTFDKIGIDLRQDVFNHGQLYVALSRVRSWDSLKVYLGSQHSDRKVKNYVYKELLNTL